MGKRQFTTLAALLGALVLQQDSWGAIDEAGMKYVSASEGFGGSIRLNFLHKFQREILVGDGRRVDHPRDHNTWESNYASSRLYLNGNLDLNNSWKATYYFEFRPGESANANAAISPGQAGTGIGIAYQDIGLQGAFGWLRIGTIESVSSAMVPSADLTNDIGTSGMNLAEDYDNGIRWISPAINNLQFGASFRVKDRFYDRGEDSTRADISNNDFKDRTVDEWDVATIYSLKDRLEVGFSYAQKNARARNDANASGFKVGISHSRKNWGLSYNFHRYKAYNPHNIRSHQSIARQSDNERFWHYREFNSSSSSVQDGERLPNGVVVSSGSTGANNQLSEVHSLVLNFNEHTTYLEHVVGANLLFGRFNFAVNYSLSTTENNIVDTSSAPGTQSLSYKVKGLRGDVAYNLGSKSKIIAAARKDRFDQEIFDENVYYLMYRVDF